MGRGDRSNRRHGTCISNKVQVIQLLLLGSNFLSSACLVLITNTKASLSSSRINHTNPYPKSSGSMMLIWIKLRTGSPSTYIEVILSWCRNMHKEKWGIKVFNVWYNHRSAQKVWGKHDYVLCLSISSLWQNTWDENLREKWSIVAPVSEILFFQPVLKWWWRSQISIHRRVKLDPHLPLCT